ncbi:MAG TPA: HD domain-containing phosphohydrolase, partial [bacterium]|nr:HD domain-containing phosphohydrolase [bacterium]
FPDRINKLITINKIILNAIYSAYTAKAMNINKLEIEKLLSAVILLDVGFYKLPERLLNRKIYYDNEEAKEILKHPFYSFDILRNIIGFDTIVASLVYMSHERINGGGYPRKLKASEIPELAQIIGITDTFTELKYSPKYKNMLNPELIYELIASDSFDKKISEIFIKAIPPYPIGTTVYLNNGEIGVVIDYDESQPFKPKIRKLDAGNLYKDIIEYDLKQDKNLKITGYVW